MEVKGLRPSARRAARRTVSAVAPATSAARMKPSFIVVGAQRSGTTSLYRALSAHPNVVRPLFFKGVHYFDVAYDRGLPWYGGHFPLRTTGWNTARQTKGVAVTFESSGYYMHHPLAPARIAQDLPDVKIVVMLRDPVERAYSAHRHELLRGLDDVESFERALDLEPERLAGEVDRIRADSSYQSWSHRHHSYIDRGQYAEQLDTIFDTFGRERVHVLDSEAFFERPELVYAETLDFLELPQWVPSSFERHNARPRSPMLEATRCRLRAHYTEWDDRLEAQLGRALAWRT
jgi:Sulfotransferase domain